jgi:hypothetical protein
MAALSDYLESGLLNYIFRGQSFPQPPDIAIVLTSGVPHDSNNGSSSLYGGQFPELPSSIDYNGRPTLIEHSDSPASGTGYRRVRLGDPAAGDPLNGLAAWSYMSDDYDGGSGIIRNSGQIVFNTALTDWGWVSGVAIVDNGTIGEGNLLMHAQLDNPRLIYTGDNVKFDVGTLEISFK